MAAPADVNGENGSEGLISSTDKRDLDKLIARVAGFAITDGTIDSDSRCAAYTATISGIGTTLTAGTVIYIKTHANSAEYPTLNVNSIGAKPIHWRTSAVANDKLGPNYIFMLVYDGTNWVIPYDYDTDTKVTNTVNTTTKAYITGTTSASTNTGTQIFDTGVYVGTTAGELNSTTYKLNEAVTFEYNSTNQCVDFIFAE